MILNEAYGSYAEFHSDHDKGNQPTSPKKKTWIPLRRRPKGRPPWTREGEEEKEHQGPGEGPSPSCDHLATTANSDLTKPAEEGEEGAPILVTPTDQSPQELFEIMGQLYNTYIVFSKKFPNHPKDLAASLVAIYCYHLRRILLAYHDELRTPSMKRPCQPTTTNWDKYSQPATTNCDWCGDGERPDSPLRWEGASLGFPHWEGHSPVLGLGVIADATQAPTSGLTPSLSTAGSIKVGTAPSPGWPPPACPAKPRLPDNTESHRLTSTRKLCKQPTLEATSQNRPGAKTLKFKQTNKQTNKQTRTLMALIEQNRN